MLSDDPELTVKGVNCGRDVVDGKEAAPTLECHIVTVSILLAAVTPVTLEMAGQRRADEEMKGRMLAACLKDAGSLDDLAGMESDNRIYSHGNMDKDEKMACSHAAALSGAGQA